MKKHLEGGADPDVITEVDYWEHMLSEHNLAFIKKNALIDAEKYIPKLEVVTENPVATEKPNSLWNRANSLFNRKQPKQINKLEEAHALRKKAVETFAEEIYQEKIAKFKNNLEQAKRKEEEEINKTWSNTTEAGGSKKKRSKKGKNTIKKVSRNKVSRKRRNKR